MKYVLQLLRILVGILFIFSGLVKANDPAGLANKMVEFFDVLHIAFLIPYALGFSVLMIAFEIIAGVALLLGFAFRTFSFLLLLLIIFFAFLTGYVYYWDVIMHSAKVRECGCFGDCIKISNSATFWKDIALLIGSVILFAGRKQIRPLLPRYPNTALFILAAFFAFGVQWWALEHLPFHDCMPYAVGKNLCEGVKPPSGSHPDVYKSMLLYKNLKTGATQNFSQENYPWEDTVNWVFVSRTDSLVSKGNSDPEIKDFQPKDYAGNDYTDAILQDPGYKFLLFLKDPPNARADHMDRLKDLFTQASAKGITCIVLCSASKAAADEWHTKWGVPAEYYSFDATANKTAIRSDPGLMLLQGCTVRGKWSFRDYPKNLAESGVR